MPHATIRQLRIDQSLNDVIDILVSQQERAKPTNLQALLARHSEGNSVNLRLLANTYYQLQTYQTSADELMEAYEIIQKLSGIRAHVYWVAADFLHCLSW